MSSKSRLTHLSLTNVNVGTSFETCTFPVLTHLHLDTNNTIQSLLSAICAVQDTLRCLSVSVAYEDEDVPLPSQLTLTNLLCLRFGYLSLFTREIYALFGHVNCPDIIITGNMRVDRPYLMEELQILLDGGIFPGLERLSVGGRDNKPFPVDRYQSFMDVCTRRGIRLDQSLDTIRLPSCFAVNDLAFD